eukprot:Nk52_evm75s1444 gene=Nk52_evmTU75s1444
MPGDEQNGKYASYGGGSITQANTPLEKDTGANIRSGNTSVSSSGSKTSSIQVHSSNSSISLDSPDTTKIFESMSIHTKSFLGKGSRAHVNYSGDEFMIKECSKETESKSGVDAPFMNEEGVLVEEEEEERGGEEEEERGGEEEEEDMGSYSSLKSCDYDSEESISDGLPAKDDANVTGSNKSAEAAPLSETSELTLGDKLERFSEAVAGTRVLEVKQEADVIEMTIPRYEVTRAERKQLKKEKFRELLREKEAQYQEKKRQEEEMRQIKLEEMERRERERVKEKEKAEELKRQQKQTARKQQSKDKDKNKNDSVQPSSASGKISKTPAEKTTEESSVASWNDVNEIDDEVKLERSDSAAKLPKEMRLSRAKDKFRTIVWNKVLKKSGPYNFTINPGIAQIIAKSKEKKLASVAGKTDDTPKIKSSGQFSLLKFNRNVQTNVLTAEQKDALTAPPGKRTGAHCSALFDLINGLPNFNKYSESIKRDISKVVLYEVFERDRIVCKQGHAATKLYFIINGACYVNVFSAGEERTVNTLEAGDNFGENALNKDALRAATIQCKENCEFLCVKNVDFVEIIREFQKGELEMKENFLQNVFGGELSSSAITKLAGHLQLQFKYPEETVIYKEGATPDYIYFIISGDVIMVKETLVPPILQGDPRPTLLETALHYSNNRYYCKTQYEHALGMLERSKRLTVLPNPNYKTLKKGSLMVASLAKLNVSKIPSIRPQLKHNSSDTATEFEEFCPKCVMRTTRKTRITEENMTKLKLPDHAHELERTRKRRALYMAELQKSPEIRVCNKHGLLPFICFSNDEASLHSWAKGGNLLCQRAGTTKNLVVRKLRQYDYFGENGLFGEDTNPINSGKPQRVNSAIAINNVHVYAISMSVFANALSPDDMLILKNRARLSRKATEIVESYKRGVRWNKFKSTLTQHLKQGSPQSPSQIH